MLAKFFKRPTRKDEPEPNKEGKSESNKEEEELIKAYSLITRHANAPSLDIEIEVAPDIFGRLIEKVENTWSRLGQEDAHWSVITSEKFRKNNIDENLEEFFAMGEGDISRVEFALNRVGVSLSDIDLAIDFGCGVARLSIPLAKRCKQVLGADISNAHLQEAKTNVQRAGLENLDLRLVGSISAIRDLPEANLVFSLIVLQHNSPPVMLEILKALCSRVKTGGFLYIQVPTYRVGYRYDAESDLANTSGEMAMHVLSQDILLQTIQDAGLTILEVAEDGSAWNLDFCSQVVLAKRR
jgi:2-polyprenyl-3-methyl-5-hydroxy-6-metoxy-1,4-benzoquinol methylase